MMEDENQSVSKIREYVITCRFFFHVSYLIKYSHNILDVHIFFFFQTGDQIRFIRDDKNGYSAGENLRTGKSGLFPSYKVEHTVKAVNMPVYPEVS